MDAFAHLQPAFMLFLLLGVGYVLGNIRLGSFSFGPVAGVLFAGLLFGQFDFRITPAAQSVGFAMFIFSVGYQAGPQFFEVLKKDGLRYLSLSLVVAGTGFGLAAGWAWWFELAPGASAGLLAGGLTSSPTLAAAQDAIQAGTVPVPGSSTAEQMMNNVASAYAITYIFGLAGLITAIKLLPGWLGIDLAVEAERFTSSSQAPAKPVNVTIRRYRVKAGTFTELSVEELSEKYWDQVTVVKAHRDDKPIKLKDEDHLEAGDVLEMIGPRRFFIEVAPLIGEEIPLGWSIRTGSETAQVIVMRPEVANHSLTETDIPGRFGLLVQRINRGGVELPLDPALELEKGDILTVVGPSAQVDALGEYLGLVEREISETDMVTFALGIAAGILVGYFSVNVAGINLGLGSAGGLLLSGLVIGRLRSLRPTFGRLPDAARWVLMELGLLLFMAGVGLRAGGSIVEILIQAGPVLVLGGVIITLTPIAVGYFFGRKVLKIEPVLLFGGITGAMTSGAALGVVTSTARSMVPALGYTGTYAFSNVLLMVAGSLILLF